MVEPTHPKNMLVKLETFPKKGVKIKHNLKPPPRWLLKLFEPRHPGQSYLLRLGVEKAGFRGPNICMYIYIVLICIHKIISLEELRFWKNGPHLTTSSPFKIGPTPVLKECSLASKSSNFRNKLELLDSGNERYFQEKRNNRKHLYYLPGTQMTLVLVGAYALFFKTKGHGWAIGRYPGEPPFEVSLVFQW